MRAHPRCVRLRSMRSFNAVGGLFERQASDGREREYGEKAMKGDEGSSESSSLHPQ